MLSPDGQYRQIRAQDLAFVPPSATGGLRQPSNVDRGLRAVLDRIGGYGWVVSHTFRRTVATRLDEAGCSAKQIADQLGHAQPSITQDVYMGRGVACADREPSLDEAPQSRTAPAKPPQLSRAEPASSLACTPGRQNPTECD